MDGQYRILKVDFENNKIFSRLKYANTHEYFAGYSADEGRVQYAHTNRTPHPAPGAVARK